MKDRHNAPVAEDLRDVLEDVRKQHFPAVDISGGDEVKVSAKRERRPFTAAEAYHRISSILKRTPVEARAKVLAAAHQVIELG